MKSIIFSIVFTLFTANLFAQKESFDVLTYKPIKNWKKEKTEKSVSFSITDEAKGTFCIISLYPSIDGEAESKTNFDNSWEKIAKEQLGAGDATMEAVNTENGWELQTGSASFDKGGLSGIAMLVTATSHTKMVNMLVLFNSDTYSTQLNDFIRSIELKKVSVSNYADFPKGQTSNSTNAKNNQLTELSEGNDVNNTIVGVWTNNILETSGYMNNVPQYSGGYFRKEYTFKSNGTYFYSFKSWSVYAKSILYGYETGTWSTNGNTLILTPKEGKKGEWNKKSTTNEWGSQIKLQPMKLEKVSYTFETKFFSDSQSGALYLDCGKSTERDGTYSGNGFSYALKEKAIIDFPPGFKITTASVTNPSTPGKQQTTVAAAKVATNNPLAGKIWEAYLKEKYPSSYGSMSGNYTGGFWLYQYQFNHDGTYRFVYNAASALATKPVNLLQYETGTYAINGNQLTITAQKGSNEEWSVGKINNGMSETHIREILKTRLKFLKASARELEKVTYPLSIEFWQGNNVNALCLQHTQNTVREGSPGTNNQSCFFETASAKATKFPEIK